MKLRRKLFAAVSSLAVAATVLLTGCGAPAQEGTALKETGTLTLSVNPEIQIEYNRDGKVTALTGRNDDGKSIVEAYPDYIGKDCEIVLRDLIVEINEAGYFVDDIDGNKKNIVLQLEPGSVLPSDDFLADMSASTQGGTPATGSGSTNYNDTDYGPNNDGVSDYNDTDYGPNNDGVTDYNDTDYGPNNDGVTDYNDTDYGPNNDGVTDYNDTDYGPNNDGVTNYNDTNYDDHGNTNYGDTNYDDGGSDYDREADDDWDDGDSGYDD